MTEEKIDYIRHKKGCKLCGSQKGVISKYKLGICRRCFKQNAQKLGFKKYD
ncbi:MAG: 30S ribosomal protein S14 [archaeon]|jgi:ribosomal protein S14